MAAAAAPASAQQTEGPADTGGGTIDLAPVQVQGAAPTGGVAIQSDRVDSPNQVPSLDKTGTPLSDIPGSVHVIPREVLTQQGDTMLRQGLYNAPGVNFGGQDSKGFYDHFEIRGLNAQIFSDGFSDGDQLGGISHSLNGVQSVEVLEGPGSALFGSGPPGGTINIVHFTPSDEFHYGGGLELGTDNSQTGTAYATGATNLPGLDFRIDATVAHADGFRDLESEDYELRPSFTWQLGDHTLDFSVDTRHIHETPDSYGIIYFQGQPLRNVPDTAKYSSPFATSAEDIFRPEIIDKWRINDSLTVNNRFSYLLRTLDTLGNGDSSSTKVTGTTVTGRQLRRQNDRDNSFDYQLEPVWKFATGPIGHTFLTGFEYQHQTISTDRTTADLPNIANAFAPVPPETTPSTLAFLCDATHSCDNDQLVADYTSLYATDQVDVTDKIKFRAGVRQDFWNTALTPLISVPGAFGTNGQPLLANKTQSRNDTPVSWNVGALYKVLPWASPYAGVSVSHLTNFNSENAQSSIGAPELARQYEGGIKFAFLDDTIVFNTDAFTVSRNNVAAATTISGIETVVFDSQKTKGLEGSLDTKITEQWHVLANATLQNAFITNNPQGVTSVGHHPQGVPTRMANLWTTYDFAIMGEPGFQVGAGLNYEDKTYSDITNQNSVPSYVIGNLEFGYQTPVWGAALNIKNVTDERYFVAANGAGGYVGNPLTAYVSAHFNY
ncbi:MAG TPA: TonB-dependent siderophore receptor [Stellaceae bacterium]|nr:TonB-dependent siderophore receptor [Stellaceae bacterium]